MILSIPQLLSRDEVALVRQHLVRADWQSGTHSAGAQASRVKHNQQLDPQSELAQQLSERILARLAKTPAFIAAALPLKILPPMFNRYSDGGQYGAHVDNAIRFLPGSGERLRTDLSATLFLSEPDGYAGGELCIDDKFGSQRIKLGAGDLVLYPATSLHRVEPVTQGERLAAFFWIQSMVRSHEQREMLYDLDQSVQSISQRQGVEDSDAVRLSTLYHRLLQQWAET